ncbi:NB-ARC domain, LRR domain containing protein, partial [Parasponia andersonii]
SELRAVAVVGMGGLGKTTLMSRVYEDFEVKKHFQHHAWVTVSQSFKIDDILRQIIQQLFDQIRQPLPQGANSADNYTLKRIMIDFLRGKRYLLVLDDVWSVDAWDAVRMAFPNDNTGSRLMIATRISEVASFYTKDLGGMIFPLRPLTLEESWSLFCAKTFPRDRCPTHLEKICRNILKRCEGLPLAIVAIGGMLATKDITKIDEWEIVNRCLGAELEGNKKLKGMQEILLLGFNDLPYNLKHCFMYLSIFPEDYLIRRKMLIRLWIAEGFTQETEGRTLEEVGDGYFNELLNRSLIQAAGDRIYSTSGRITHCRVHDFLRELILLKSQDQNISAITNDKIERLPERVRRLSVHKGTKIDVYGNNNLCRLRSVLFFGEEDGELNNFLSSFLDSGVRLLKVMDCSNAPLRTFPKDITKLYHLRYLSLRNTSIRTIPCSIGKLRNLETLDLKNTSVEELPVEITKIHCLRHVIVYRNNSRLSTGRIHGFKALEGIEALSSLRKLCHIEANPGGAANLLTSIGRLTQLTMLGILQLAGEHGHTLCSSIDKLKYLRSLSLDSRDENEILNIQFLSSSPPQFLQRLHMRGRLETFPHWLHNLTHLVKLVFKFSRLQVDPLESLQALPNLLLLIFYNGAYDGEALCFKAGGFQMLNHFSVIQGDRLSKVKVEEGAMPRLEYLWLEDCKSLKEIPPGVERLSNLKRLGLVNMADELTRTINRGSQDKNYLRVKHIPSVFVGQRTNEEGFSGHFL